MVKIIKRKVVINMVKIIKEKLFRYRIAGKFGGDLNLALWFEIVNIKSGNINYWS